MGHHRRGWQYLRNEDWASAREEFQQAIRIVEVFPTAYYGLGKAHMGAREYAAAVTSFSTSRDQYLMLIGRDFTSQLEAKQRRQDQIQELRSLIDELRTQPGMSTISATARSRQLRDFTEYLRQLEDTERSGHSLSRDVAVPAEIYLSLGSALFRSNRFPEAEAEYLNALKVNKDFGEAHNNLAVIYMMKYRYQDALTHLKAAEKAGYRVNPELKEQIKSRMAQ